MEEEKKTKYTIECVTCERMFDCKGMPLEVDLCIKYKERNKSE